MSVRLLSCFSTSEELAQHWKENERMEEVSVTMYMYALHFSVNYCDHIHIPVGIF